MLGAYNVNGTPCELLIDQDALSWWPRAAASCGASGASSTSNPTTATSVKSSDLTSPIKHLKRLSRSGSSSEVDRPATQPVAHCADRAPADEVQKRLRRVDFNQIIGVTKVHIKKRERTKKRSLDADQATDGDGTASKQIDDSEIRKADDGAQPATSSPDRIVRLKVYYVKRNEKKSTGRLLKLKKITISLPQAETPSLNHAAQPEASSPADLSPSSSISSSSTAASPIKQVQADFSALSDLHDLIEQHLELKRRQRPRRLLVFVNPFGGKGKAFHLFKSKVRKIFDLAQIECQLIVTKYANHARNTIEDPMFDLEQFDGIICIGGDGMFSELMNGLLFRFNRDKLLSNELKRMNERFSDRLSLANDSDDGEAITGRKETAARRRRMDDQLKHLRASLGGIGQPFQSPNIPVGVIGAGSTDANLFGFIGTNDTVSATLNIVLGNQIQIDVCSIHSIQEDRLMRFVSTFVAYGYFGDVIRESERFRWLGPSRYDLTALNSLIKYRCYDGLVRILRSKRDGTPLDLSRCHLNCRLCRQTSNSFKAESDNNNHLTGSLDEEKICKKSLDALAHDEDEFEILEEEGPFVGVNAAVTACRCPQTRKGFSPGNHLANGCADLILVKPCSRMQYINYLIRTGYTNKSAFDLQYVDAYRCRQFEFVAKSQQAVDKKFDNTQSVDDNATSDYQSKGSTKLSTNDTSIGSSQYSSNANSLDSKQTDSNQLADLAGHQSPLKGRLAESRSVNYGSAEGADNDGHDFEDELSNSSWNADGEIMREQSIRVKVNNKLLRVFGTGEPQPRPRRRKPQTIS